MRKGSVKLERINEEFLRETARIIRDEVKDPRVDPLISVTRVEVTPDLQYAVIRVSSLGGERRLERSIEGLTSSSGFIRSRLAHSVNLRKTPELRFVPDRSMEYAMEMSAKIDEVMAEQSSKAHDETSD